MSKKPKETGQKSAAILEYLHKNPDASPAEVVQALAVKGLEVRAGLVSNIKYQAKQSGVILGQGSKSPEPVERRETSPPPFAGENGDTYTLQEVVTASKAIAIFHGDLDRLFELARELKKAT